MMPVGQRALVRVFCQVAAQPLVAAGRTVPDDREVHSLHAYFLLPGDSDAPIVYQVERIRDGKSFSARRVQAVQHGRPILSLIASFQAPEPGFEPVTGGLEDVYFAQVPLDDAP